MILFILGFLILEAVVIWDLGLDIYLLGDGYCPLPIDKFIVECLAVSLDSLPT